MTVVPGQISFSRERGRSRVFKWASSDSWLSHHRGNGTVKAVPHLSVAERVARGKAARTEVPRASQARVQPAAAAP